MVRSNPHSQKKRLSTRKVLLVWFGCALAGWLVAILSIYGVLRFGDEVVAFLTGTDDVQITDQDERSMQEIAPAAGDND